MSASLAIIWTEYLSAEGGLLDFVHVEKWRGKIGYLFRCPVCLSGQIALWTYIIAHEEYVLLNHLALVGITMLTTAILINRVLYGD